jgi:hypothetical protein
MKLARVAALVALTLLPATGAFAQCSMCRTALESSEEGRALSVKLNRGILVLLGAPFGTAAFIAAAMVRSRKRLGAS